VAVLQAFLCARVPPSGFHFTIKPKPGSQGLDDQSTGPGRMKKFKGRITGKDDLGLKVRKFKDSYGQGEPKKRSKWAILIVDDEFGVRESFRMILKSITRYMLP
jgi:hypothetical protein